MKEYDLRYLKRENVDNSWKHSTRKVDYPYEYFNSIDEYQKPVDNIKKENFFSKFKK